MKTAILHLSDLHISSPEDYIVSRTDIMANGIRYYINECNRCIIVITGDIIDKGNVAAYSIAKDFLTTLKNALSSEKEIDIDFVIVPGNHDIDFSQPQKLRNMSIDSLNKLDILSDDNGELLESVLAPQQSFWAFCKELCGEDHKNQISFNRTYNLNNGGHLSFHCYNTALLSTINEQPGSLLVFEDTLVHQTERTQNDIVVSVFHHSPSWLSTRTSRNNQKQFQKHLLKETNIILCGHEHMSHSLTLGTNYKASGILYMEADSFKYGDDKIFDLIIIEDEGNKPVIERLSFQLAENDSCHLLDDNELTLEMERTGLTFSDTHSEYLSTLSLPIKHPRLEKITLQDIYVYPHIAPLSKDNGKALYVHEDTSNFPQRAEAGKVYIFEGDNQSGKTALLKQLSLDSYLIGVYPIWLNGAELKHPNISSLLKKAFKAQYDKSSTFDDFISLHREQRIIFIDNIDKSPLNQEGIDKLIDLLLLNYRCVIMTSKPNTDVLAIIRQSDKNSKYNYYQILSFGHVKRNELIEKWFRLGIDNCNFNDADIIDKVKLVYNQITSILSGDLLPAYPAFLLTILHGMGSMVESFNLTPTSYANLYHTLLITSLGRADVPQEKINGVLMFLTELAFEMYEKNEREIGLLPNIAVINFDSFFVKYAETRIAPYSASSLISYLIQARILSVTDSGNLCFSYKYIYYYLVGRKLAALVDTGKGMTELTKLCKDINKEEPANILIFLAYLVKNPTSLLDEIRLTNQIPLNDIIPISLKLDDPLFVRLSGLVKSIKEQVLLTDVNHKEARAKLLKASDDAEIHSLDSKESKPDVVDFEELNEYMQDIHTILKSVRVIGQIVKNQSGTLTIPELESLVADSYLSSFRLIGHFTQVVEENFTGIVDEICSIHKIDITNRNQVENHVSNVLSGLLFKLCLSVFSNLALSVGTTDLQQIFDSVAEKIGSPAAQLISFTINSYYGPFRIEYLKDMVNKYSNNPVVMNIIQARVRHYVYHHDLTYDKKQQFGELSGLKLINSHNRYIP